MKSARCAAIVFAAGVVTLWAAMAPGQPQSKDQRRCVTALNKDGAKLAAAQGKDNSTCLKDGGKGKLVGQTVRQCLTAHNRGKVAKKEKKARDDFAKKCAAQMPDFGVPAGTAHPWVDVNAAATGESLAMFADVFGPNINSALIPCDSDKDGCKCQQTIARDYTKLAAAKLKEFIKCKKFALADKGKLPFPDGAAAAADLEICLTDEETPGSVKADTKGKIGKKVTKLGEHIAAKCDAPGVTAVALASGKCAGLAGAALRDCIDRIVECRVCRTLNRMDNLDVDCDEFDDGLGNGTCAGRGSFDTSYGNGGFGTWVNDEFGLPAYRYSGCVAEPCTEPEDVFHQLGNDDITAVAHGDGYVELFTVKTFYRFANKYDDGAGNYAGGFGWVRDGGETWSTLYDDRPVSSSYERLFGMGYYKKEIEHGDLLIRQYVYPPSGGDEALLEKLVFTNLSGAEKSISYFDYWDVAWWLVKHSDAVTDTSEYDPAAVKTYYDPARATIKVVSQAAAGDYEQPSLTQDPSPKVSFVTFLDDMPDAFDTVQTQFLGAGGRQLPERVNLGQLGGSLDASGTLSSEAAVLVTQKNFTLGPGESRSLHVLYGLTGRGQEDDLIDAYRAGPPYTLPDVMADWAQQIPQIELPADTWIAREMAWSYYYLVSGLLREDYFATRVINQGSIYQYQWGANAGPRAALRHLVPLVYTDPSVAREVLVYYLRAMKSTGELVYATAGYGGWHPMGFLPSDHGLWLLWAAAEYVNATRDYGFLDQTYDYYCASGRGACGSATAYEMLKSAYGYQVGVVGTGANGLVRLMNSDWDDNLTSLSTGVDPAETEAHGESTMNTALALVAYPLLAALADEKDDAAFAADVRQAADDLTTAMTAQWRDDFFNRAYVYTAPGSPLEVGAGNLWLASNGPALIAPDLMTTPQVEALVSSIGTDCSDPSPIGLASQGQPLIVGLGTPGLWYSLSGPTIEGLLKHPLVSAARDLAWTEFKKQTFANHATLYPQYWYGVWSGPDMYFTPVEGVFDPGDTWCFFPGILCMKDFPVTNMFSHSEPLLSSLRMAGVSVSATGHAIDPGYPFAEFRWESQSYAVEYTAATASGRLRPSGNDTIEMRVRLPASLAPEGATVSVNGGAVSSVITDGFAVFNMPLTAGSDSTWSVQ